MTEEQKRLPLDGFVMNYGFSFGLDVCEQREDGRKIRKIILDKVESCACNENVKKEFYKSAAQMTEGVLQAIADYVDRNSKFPNNGIGDLSCDKDEIPSGQRIPDVIKKKMDDYLEGKLRLDGLTPDIIPSCSQGASHIADKAVDTPKSPK